jgi:hypothetical protein
MAESDVFAAVAERSDYIARDTAELELMASFQGRWAIEAHVKAIAAEWFDGTGFGEWVTVDA